MCVCVCVGGGVCMCVILRVDIVFCCGVCVCAFTELSKYNKVHHNNLSQQLFHCCGSSKYTA